MFESVVIRRLIIVIFIIATALQIATADAALSNNDFKNMKQILETIEGYLHDTITPLNARMQVLENAVIVLASKFDNFALSMKKIEASIEFESGSNKEHGKRSSPSAHQDHTTLDRIVQEQRDIKNVIAQSCKVTLEMNATLHELSRTKSIQGRPIPAELVQPDRSAVHDIMLEFLEEASLQDENSPAARENLEKVRDYPPEASRANTKHKKIHTADLLQQIWKKFTRPIWNISKGMGKLEEMGANGFALCERSFNQANRIEVLLAKHFAETMKPAFNCCESMLKSIDRAISRSDAQYDSVEQRFVYQNALIEKLFDKLPSINGAVQVDADATLVDNEPETRASDCAQLQYKGASNDGVYTVYVNNEKLDVFCDFSAYGGGWTVIQRRGKYGNYQENFNRNWTEYKNGFGDADREFWIGNDNLHSMTRDDVTLLVQLKDFQDNYAFAFYNLFRVSAEEDFYRLHIGEYNGNASDSFAAHNQKLFSTKDQIHDEVDPCCSCALTFEGGWWFYACFEAHLNGPYQPFPTDNGYFRGIVWEHWKGDYSLKASEMKIRPRNFKPVNTNSNTDDGNQASVEDP